MKTLPSLLLALALSLPASSQSTLTLSRVRTLAVSHNLATRSADNALLQAREQQKEAFTNYFPQVSAVGAGFKTSRDILKTNIATADVLPAQLAQLIPTEVASLLPTNIPVSLMNHGLVTGITAVQPVFAGGQIVNGNRLAKVNVEAKELQRETSRNTVLLTAEQYYWQIISLKEKQKTLDAVAALLANLEKDASVAVKAGVGMRNDLLAVQLKQNEIESQRIKLDNGLQLARMVLAQYIGMEDSVIDVATDIDPQQLPAYPAIKADHSQAVAATPEYRLLQKQVEATTLQRKMEVGKHLPSLGIGAGYSYYNMGSGLDNHFGTVFATVSVPISGWWGGSHAIKRTRLAEQNARDQLTDNMQLLKIRMQKDWNDVDNAYKQLQLAHRSIEQSEENLRLNRDYYHAGTVTMNDLLTAQQQYQQSRDAYTDAFSQLQLKIVEYRQSIGATDNLP
ncbi:MAG: TolC family protein [Prevotella sp.]|nr:TolC family protein [Prevotella sp.]